MQLADHGNSNVVCDIFELKALVPPDGQGSPWFLCRYALQTIPLMVFRIHCRHIVDKQLQMANSLTCVAAAGEGVSNKGGCVDDFLRVMLCYRCITFILLVGIGQRSHAAGAFQVERQNMDFCTML